MTVRDRITRINTQYLAAIAANLVMCGGGCAMGWISMALPLLRSDASPLDTGMLTIGEMSWIASIMPLGGLVGNCFCGIFVALFGARHTIFLLGFPQLFGWAFLIFGRLPWHLAAARFLGGFSFGGGQTSIFLFISEIASNEIRGQLSTFFTHGRNIGILLAFTLGGYVDYIKSSMLFTGITIVFLVAFWFIPSSPQYFLKKGNVDSAEKSFNFYNKHRQHTDSKLCSNQFDNLKGNASDVDKKSGIAWDDIVNARYGFFQAIMLSLLNNLTALVIFLTYGTIVIQKSGTHLPMEESCIFIGVVQFVAGMVTYKLIENGRKFLLILSLIGCAISHAIMVTYMHVKDYDIFGDYTTLFQWTPVLCMALVIFMSSVGMSPLAFIVMAESFPSKVRSFGMTFGTIVINTFAFILFKMYPLVQEAIGLQACLVIFCISCTFGTIYVAIFLEETKGKELNE